MSRGMPSMTALLGLLALAGYQNRDKLGELLKGACPAIPGNRARTASKFLWVARSEIWKEHSPEAALAAF